MPRGCDSEAGTPRRVTAVAEIASFDADLAGAFARGGALGASLAVLRTCLGWQGDSPADGDELLVVLQGADVGSQVGWRQDRIEATPRPVDEGVVVASENQGCWQAIRRPDGSVQANGRVVDLTELLCRVLVTEVVVGHGPCVMGEVPAAVLAPHVLLPPASLVDGELVGVVGTRTWFGVTTGETGTCQLSAAPPEEVRSALGPQVPTTRWFPVP